jgi:hypothetical protein
MELSEEIDVNKLAIKQITFSARSVLKIQAWQEFRSKPILSSTRLRKFALVLRGSRFQRAP